jgi:hypothetical protein
MVEVALHRIRRIVSLLRLWMELHSIDFKDSHLLSETRKFVEKVILDSPVKAQAKDLVQLVKDPVLLQTFFFGLDEDGTLLVQYKGNVERYPCIERQVIVDR